MSSFESGSQWTCAGCDFVIRKEKGILRALQPNRERYFQQFIRDYETVRAREGRGSVSPEYYLSLPDKDLTGCNSWQWQIRARTFHCLERRILPAIERAHPLGCDLLDIGAGNCWFSCRMALRGHRPVAVDLLDNDWDGLGAARHYLSRLPSSFPRFVAEMDSLPFATGQFDIVVFNASFHYSVDYFVTLTEALRCLRRPGFVILADSPLYAREESGQAMLAEKRAAFQRQFGFSSDSIPSREYLTKASLEELQRRLPLRWKMVTPWYGLQWAMRPWKARLLRQREPSRFHLIYSEVLE
ncbi:MAG TPA: class I SAM-dependent methyltransferase [Candidatus Sulfotelmatobacter sp.]|nr:class I SAM-dependent methyltransferase [Candidatus Sulfotelmatobacter sp.]